MTRLGKFHRKRPHKGFSLQPDSETLAKIPKAEELARKLAGAGLHSDDSKTGVSHAAGSSDAAAPDAALGRGKGMPGNGISEATDAAAADAEHGQSNAAADAAQAAESPTVELPTMELPTMESPTMESRDGSVVDLMPDTPILARRVETLFDNVSDEESIENKPTPVQVARRAVTFGFGMWTRISAREARRMGWIPRVEPYVGYGTTVFSRLICRTTYAPQGQERRPVHAGIRQAFMVPAGHVRVAVSIDGVPVLAVQIGSSEAFDHLDPSLVRSSASIASDSQGYLDLLIQRRLKPGVHDVEYMVGNRNAVHSQLMVIPTNASVGIISDVDDTIMVTDVPRLWSAVFNMLFRSPYRRRAVPGMPDFYQKMREALPGAPFFYLSTSPWNVESSIRHLIRANGYPQGPLLLRDFDPRPKTFVPTGVQHKLEFADQLMSDFPNMRFILLGDDGQSDPTTYATIAKKYPGRVAAIGLRQVRHRGCIESAQAMPQVDVPVFYGTTGDVLARAMMPFIYTLAQEWKR